MKDVEWREFKVGEVFEVSGTVTTHPRYLKRNGKTPRITCAATNNGLDDIYDNEATEMGDVLTVDSATDGVIFYQPYNFIATDHVEKISIKGKQKMTKGIGLFLKTNIEKAKSNKYGYGYKFSQTRIKKQIIKLPIDSQGNPNWQFMEEYIKQKEKKLAEIIVKYYRQKMDNMIGGGVQQGSLKDIEWKEFFFSDIFEDIQRGKRLIKSNQLEGNVPYISSTAFNNGVDNFIDNKENVRKFNNNITLANSGSVGTAFYQPYEYIASDHVTALKLKKGNKYIYLFLASVIKKVEEKYSFNREINDIRIKREKILLPIDDKGEPNWAYMESYIKNIEAKQIRKILRHLTYTYV